jgi:hypothetical protein
VAKMDCLHINGRSCTAKRTISIQCLRPLDPDMVTKELQDKAQSGGMRWPLSELVVAEAPMARKEILHVTFAADMVESTAWTSQLVLDIIQKIEADIALGQRLDQVRSMLVE